ncbi:MAG TPA: rRNA adenine dimethyltransferase family protein [Hyphomicrobiales bacterium]|nr:rRNA adenine dimethyltransferase family protein [Hyphomicrobiales bacterium]
MSAGDGLPPLGEVVRRHGLEPRRSLGQNFLFDLNLTRRIARAAGPLDGVTVVEVGPGPGGLTRALLAEGAARVIAIEKDARALAALAEIAACYPGRLEIIEGDALATDFDGIVAAPSPSLRGGDGDEAIQAQRAPAPAAPGLLRSARNDERGPARIVANLPYNIATPLLTGWLTAPEWPPWWDSLVLMFQREVAERIVAQPGEEAFGRLGVLAGWRSEARILFDVPAAAFVPPPKVTSSVVRLVPRPQPLPAAVADLEAVTRAAFGQRRKMLRQSLKGAFRDPAAALAATEIDPTARAETLDIAAFAALARHRAAERA